MKNKKKLFHGFTLIEMVVVLFVFVSISGIIAAIFFVALRSTKKTDLILSVRENGNHAINQMSRMIRYAKDISAPASCTPAQTNLSQITIDSEDGGITTFACTGTSIASNTANLIDINTVAVAQCSFACSQVNINTPPIIDIMFTLKQKGAAQLYENQSTIPFNTSVSLRNFQQ